MRHISNEKQREKGGFSKIGTILIMLFLLLGLATAGWWDSEWNYRKEISVTNDHNKELSKFPTNFTLDTQNLINQGKMQSDCSDIRVISEKPSEKITEYNITGCGTSSSKIFFTANISASSTATDYNIYYGNPQASDKQERVDTRIVNGKGQRGDFSYWCTHPGEGKGAGYDGFWGGKACDASANGIGNSEYTGFKAFDRVGNGDWLNSPVSGKPVLSWGEDASIVDGEDSNSGGYQGFIAYKGYPGPQEGTLGVEVPGGVKAHAWFRLAVGSCDSSTHGLTLYKGTNSSVADHPEGAVAGWMAGDGFKGVNNDELANEVLDVCNNEKKNTTSIIDPANPYIYPFVDTFTRGPADDAIAQIDDFYWSDSQGNEINLDTSKGPEETLFTVNNITTYRNGKPRTFYAENETVQIEIRGEKFKTNPEIGVITPDNNLTANRVTTTNNSGVFEYDHEVEGTEGWYEIGLQPLISAEKYEDTTDWQKGSLTNLTDSGGEIKIDYEDKSESGTFETNGSEWKNISFSNQYSDPVVFASVNTENTNDRPNLVKVKNVTSEGFQAKFCEPDSSDSCDSHDTNETVGWFAAERSDLDDLEGVEAGKINITADNVDAAKTINLDESFSSQAAVIAEQTTYNSPGESVVQVVNPGTDSFEVYLCDHDGADGCESHPEENISWIAIDPSANLPNYMEAGKTSAIRDSSVEKQSFSKFNASPVLAATINTNEGGQQSKPVRINSVTKDSANVGYCEHDTPDTCDGHANEATAWLATAEGVREPRKTAEFGSGVIDAGKRVYWHSFSISKTVPEQTELNTTFYTNKTGSWIEYDTLSDVPATRYLKFNISMEGNGTATPSVSSLSLKYNGPKDYGTIKENVFYRGETWENNYTDAENQKYTFRKPFNISEPGTMNRWMKPVEKRFDFEFQPEKDSIRILAWNGTRMLEIPVQVSDANISGETVESADLTFFTSFEKSEKRQYYMVSTRAEYKKSYQGLNGSGNKLENSFYSASFNESYGGLMKDVKNFEGLGEYVAGIRPVDYYPEVDVPSGLEVDTKRARIDSTSNVNFTRDSLSSTVKVSGNLDGSSTYPYTLSCTSYHGKAYMICEKNLTTQVGENWRDLQLNGLVFEDERFSNVAYDTGSQVFSNDLRGGDFEAGDVTNGMNWVSFYSTRTGDAVAELFLKQSHDKEDNAHFRISDGSLNDFFQHVVIDSSKSVSGGDSFYTKTARVFYNGKKGYWKADRVYRSLKNDLTVSLGESDTNDKSKPENKEFYNVSSSDQDNLTVKTKWKDDTFLKSAEAVIKMNTVYGENQTVLNRTISMKDEGSFVSERWLNLTLNASEVNAGTVWTQINVSDVSGKVKSEEFSFDISDETPPAIKDITTSPSGINGLDPNRKVNITANLTEFSNMSEAKLYYRTNSSNWTKRSLEKQNSSELFNFTYRGNFTPENSSIYEYKINGTDIENNSFKSQIRELNISFDHTWNISSNLSEIVTTYSELKKAGTLNITNIGDFNKTFRLDAGVYNSRTLLNGSSLPLDVKLEPGEKKIYNVNASGREEGSVEGTDSFQINVRNATANPDNRTADFNVITSTGGPFLYITAPEYPAGVTQGDKKQNITARVVNKGNESASEVYINIKPPEKWKASDGSTFDSEMTFSLGVGETKKFTTLANVGSNASTGDQKINITSTSENESRSEIFVVEVQEKSENNTRVIDEGGSGPGGAPSGPTSREQVEQRSDQIFNTSESFEIVRGQDQNFTVRFQNPTRFNLTNITANVEGIQSQYLKLADPELGTVKINESKNITVQITAPEYFQTGDYDLNFNITGKGIDGEGPYADYFGFTLNKDIALGVRAIPRNNASQLLNQSKQLVERMKESRLSSSSLQDIVAESRESIDSGDYSSVKENYKQIRSTYNTARETRKGIKELKRKIEKAENSGLSVRNTRKIASLAEAALDRGAYTTAADRLEEAESTYQLQTAGEVNWIYEVRSNWKKILAAIIIVSILAFAAKLRYRLYKIRKRLKYLESEERSIEDLKIQKQKKAFEEKELSLSEYEDSVDDYNEQIVQIIEERVELETERANIANFKRRDSLAQERDQLKNLIEETQRDYLEGNISDNEIYQEKVEELTERLSEIEGEIAEIDAKAQVRSQSRAGRFMEKIPIVSTGGKAE